ncbi:MAG: VOC family protein [Sphingomicrobium sp.]
MPDPKGSFIWYELISPDPAASKTFYDAVVGWDIEGEPSGQMDYRMINRSDGGQAGGVLRLTDEMRGHGGRPIWLGYLHVEDVDATISAIEGDGGTTVMPATDIPDIGRIAMIADAMGAPFYIMKPTPPADRSDAVSDVFSVDQAQHVRWNELSSSDQDGAITFFTKHFGWAQDGAMPMGELGDYKFIYSGDVRIGAIMKRPPQSPSGGWTYFIGVDDIDRAIAATGEAGGRIVHGPQEIPGGEFSLHAIDPQGAAFGLVGPRK